jgi:hypothetical protein
MDVSVSVAIFYEPFVICVGLCAFVVVLVLVAPALAKLPPFLIKFTTFTAYFLLQLKDLITPSPEELDKMICETEETENVEDLEQSRDTNSRPIVEVSEKKSEKIKQKNECLQEIQNKTPMKKLIFVTLNLLLKPSKWFTKFKKNCDFSDSINKPASTIENKLKALFLILALGTAVAAYLFPLSPVFASGALCMHIMQWGIQFDLAKYAAAIITGCLVYSLRTTFAATIVLGKHLFSCNNTNNGQPPVNRDNRSEVPSPSSTADMTPSLKMSPGRREAASAQNDSRPSIDVRFSCPGCGCLLDSSMFTSNKAQDRQIKPKSQSYFSPSQRVS